MDKIYLNADEILFESFKLAKQIYDSNYIPDIIIGIWRGGSLITLAVDEYFRFKNIKIPTYPLKSEAYNENNELKDIKIFGVDFILNLINEKTKVLIVDDVLDSGLSLNNILNELKKITNNIKIATLYFKPESNKTNIKPDFYLHETNKWIVFPHELESLNSEEIKLKNSKIHSLLL